MKSLMACLLLGLSSTIVGAADLAAGAAKADACAA